MEPEFPLVYLSLESWSFDDFFAPPALYTLHPMIETANNYQAEAHIENHAFFEIAQRDKEGLSIWVSQEAVVTNAFSQILIHLCAQIKNVHIRAAFMPVITGEHHSLKNGVAEDSHPWLLRQLCLSLGIVPGSIKPLPFTVEFLNVLVRSTRSLYTGLGALGVGNERMLIPEYTAVKKCFEIASPDARYEGFLNANIMEDVSHSRIIERIASNLIRSDEDAVQYCVGAKEGVDARVKYYDELASYVRSS